MGDGPVLCAGECLHSVGLAAKSDVGRGGGVVALARCEKNNK